MHSPFNQRIGRASGKAGHGGVGTAAHLEAALAQSEWRFTRALLGKGPWGWCVGGCTRPGTCVCLCFLMPPGRGRR